MKRLLPLSLLVLLLVSAMTLMHTPPAQSEPAKGDKVLRHIVLFNFKEDATEDKIQEVVDAFGQLPKKINEIHAFEWGKNQSPENRSKGFTHCFQVTFTSDEDLETYLPHAAHQEFVKLVGPVMEDVLVVDYWASE